MGEVKVQDTILSFMGDVTSINEEALTRIKEALELDEHDERLVTQLVAYVLARWAKHSGANVKTGTKAFSEMMKKNRKHTIASIQAVVELLQSLGRGEKPSDRWKGVIH